MIKQFITMATERGLTWFAASTGSDRDAIPILFRPYCDYIIHVDDISDNGNPHVHMVLKFKKKYTRKQVIKCLPKEVRNAIQYLELSKNPNACVSYIAKKIGLGMTPISWGHIPEKIQYLLKHNTPKGFNNKTKDLELSCFQKLVNREYESREEAIEDFKRREARTFLMQSASLMSKIGYYYPSNPYQAKYTLDEFNVPPLDFSNMRSKVLIGPTNIGKTQFAKAHFHNPVRVTIKQSLADVTDETDGLIIDDMTFCKNNPVEFLHMLDMRESCDTRVLYGKAFIREGMPRIFTANSEEVFWPETVRPETLAAYKTRVDVIHYHSNLWGEPKIDYLKQAEDAQTTNSAKRVRVSRPFTQQVGQSESDHSIGFRTGFGYTDRFCSA